MIPDSAVIHARIDAANLTWSPARICGKVHNMDTINFEQARAAHLALKEFFASHPKGPLDPATLVDVQAMCRAAEHAVPDIDCRRAIRSIETYSELLIARDSPSRGADFVRLRVQNALASFRSKLKAIEAGEATLS